MSLQPLGQSRSGKVPTNVSGSRRRFRLIITHPLGVAGISVDVDRVHSLEMDRALERPHDAQANNIVTVKPVMYAQRTKRSKNLREMRKGEVVFYLPYGLDTDVAKAYEAYVNATDATGRKRAVANLQTSLRNVTTNISQQVLASESLAALTTINGLRLEPKQVDVVHPWTDYIMPVLGLVVDNHAAQGGLYLTAMSGTLTTFNCSRHHHRFCDVLVADEPDDVEDARLQGERVHIEGDEGGRAGLALVPIEEARKRFNDFSSEALFNGMDKGNPTKRTDVTVSELLWYTAMYLDTRADRLVGYAAAEAAVGVDLEARIHAHSR